MSIIDSTKNNKDLCKFECVFLNRCDEDYELFIKKKKIPVVEEKCDFTRIKKS